MTIEEYCEQICKKRPTEIQLDIVNKLEEIRNEGYQKGYTDGRNEVLNEVIEKIKSGQHCSPSACKHYYEISDHFVDGDCTRECEDPIIEMIEQMKGESK